MKLGYFMYFGITGYLPGLATSSQPISLSSQNLTIDLGYATYSGTSNSTTGINSWLGIRYASPPIGQLRYQAPQLPRKEPASQIIQADSFAKFAQCPQSGYSGKPLDVGAEDCLFLSVFSPANAMDLPVFVWIHGGGFSNGNGKLDFTPTMRAGNNSFIMVVIQYRLNTFGFLSSADVRGHGQLNAGLLDQKMALEWVQSYIHLFGGNSSHVTVGGESAGASSIYYHTTAVDGALGSSLWQGSILSSAAVIKPYHYTAAQVARPYYRLVEAAGCLTNQTTLQCLRDAPFEILQNATNMITNSEIYGVPPFAPVVDETYLLKSPSDQLLSTRLNGQYSLVGNQANEGFDFVPVPGLPNPLFPQALNTTDHLRNYISYLFPLLPQSVVDIALAHYSPTTLPSKLEHDALALSPIHEIAINIVGEVFFYCPSEWMSAALPKAWRYQIAVPPALHASDLSIYEPTNVTGLGNPGQNFTQEFRDALLGTWTNFIRSWDPDPSGSLSGIPATSQGGRQWPLFTPADMAMLNLNVSGAQEAATYNLGGFNISQAVGGVNNFTLIDEATWQGGRAARCDFWRSLGELLPA